MNKKSLSTLEFYKITDQLVSYACCDGAKKILRNLKPMTDITDINLRLDETNDALSRIFRKVLLISARLRIYVLLLRGLRLEAPLIYQNFLI